MINWSTQLTSLTCGSSMSTSITKGDISNRTSSKCLARLSRPTWVSSDTSSFTTSLRRGSKLCLKTQCPNLWAFAKCASALPTCSVHRASQLTTAQLGTRSKTGLDTSLPASTSYFLKSNSTVSKTSTLKTCYKFKKWSKSRESLPKTSKSRLNVLKLVLKYIQASLKWFRR